MDQFPEPGFEGPAPEIDQMVVELQARAEKLGLYMRDAMIATTDEDVFKQAAANNESIKVAIENGATFLVMSVFQIGDQAFSKRVQDPEQYEIDKEAQVILPDPAEELRQRLLEGKGLFDDDDDDDSVQP